MQSTGQSGLPWLRHYRSFVTPWARVEYVPLWPPRPAQAQVLRLLP
jgi:acyl-homoserine lactone acylase PvdQ